MSASLHVLSSSLYANMRVVHIRVKQKFPGTAAGKGIGVGAETT
jgi:hypothetical protein